MNERRPQLLRNSFFFLLTAVTLLTIVAMVPMEPLDRIHKLFIQAAMSFLAVACLAGAVWMAVAHFRKWKRRIRIEKKT